jgi:3-deoxy-7-phosphoheptulonate synthase
MNALVNTLEKTTVKETALRLPAELKADLPLSVQLAQQISEQRQTIENILTGKDHRLLVITGPCSIHDPQSALEYAEKLLKLQAKVADQIFFVMRAYIEKPRTTVGWKGFLYDPNLDGSANMQLGLKLSRELYLQIIEMGLPISTEILSPMATAYFDDLISWGANGTDGSIQIALDAIQSASNCHQFMGLGQNGLPCLIESNGNPQAHLILRGSNTGTNYHLTDIQAIQEKSKGQLPALIIDCSHGNSSKNPLNQPEILKTIVEERALTNVRGVMLESHLVDGNQKISCDMTYGQSVTDGCLGWDKTEQSLLAVADSLRLNHLKRSA